MTGQDIVDAVRAEVIEPNPLFFTNTNLLRLINQAQKNYVRRTRVLVGSATLSTQVGVTTYPMPANWLGSEKLFWNFPTNGTDSWTPLGPTGIEKMSQESPNFLSSDPSRFGRIQKAWIEGKTLHVYPAPQTVSPNDLFMFFEAKPVPLLTLADQLSIDDSLSDGIEAYVLWKMWKQDQEVQLAEEQRIRYEGQMPGGSGGEIGQGLKWKKKRILDGKWKMDIESFLPFNYSSVNNSAFNNQLNPLNL